LADEDFDIDVLGFNDHELDGLLNSEIGPIPVDKADGAKVDHAKEWVGMPEFDQKDKTSYQAIHVHFFDEEGVKAFAELIGQKLTPKTRSIWFPEAVIEHAADKQYGAES